MSNMNFFRTINQIAELFDPGSGKRFFKTFFNAIITAVVALITYALFNSINNAGSEQEVSGIYFNVSANKILLILAWIVVICFSISLLIEAIAHLCSLIAACKNLSSSETKTFNVLTIIFAIIGLAIIAVALILAFN